MIGTMSYEEVLSIAKELETSVKTINNVIKDQNINELEDFTSTVESYAKYLQTTVELNKDADKVIEKLKNDK
jgi:hypothetical protein